MTEAATETLDPACIELQNMRTTPRPPTHAGATMQQDGLVLDRTNITRILIVGFSYIFAGAERWQSGCFDSLHSPYLPRGNRPYSFDLRCFLSRLATRRGHQQPSDSPVPARSYPHYRSNIATRGASTSLLDSTFRSLCGDLFSPGLGNGLPRQPFKQLCRFDTGQSLMAGLHSRHVRSRVPHRSVCRDGTCC